MLIISAAPQEHPFLICKREQFPELRARAEHEPWKTMARKAHLLANTELGEYNERELNDHIGACALTYILEPDQAERYAHQVYEGIISGLNNIRFNEDQNHGVIRALQAAFIYMLALDIVQVDLTAEQIKTCETLIEKRLQQVNREGNWPLGRYGAFHTWDIYRGQFTGPDDAYYDELMSQMLPDGVSPVAPNYAAVRIAMGDNKRLQKSAYMDVMEFTGVDYRYYDNQRLQQFLRWFYGSNIGPDGNYLQFGDMFPNARPRNQMLVWRIGRFDKKAAAYAANILKSEEPDGHFLPYILMKDSLPEPITPASRFFRHGGAFFHANSERSSNMSALLYNITGQEEWHTNFETNGLGLNAFGNRMLLNGGWLGPVTAPAPLQNTITIDRKNHTLKHGDGIVRGILTPDFDFALGDSGEALAEGKFQRALFFIHPTEAMPGYVVVVDRIDSDKAHTIQIGQRQGRAKPNPNGHTSTFVNEAIDAPRIRLTRIRIAGI